MKHSMRTIIDKKTTCAKCAPIINMHGRVKAIELCALHLAAPLLLGAAKQFLKRVSEAEDEARFTEKARKLLMDSVEEFQTAIQAAESKED